AEEIVIQRLNEGLVSVAERVLDQVGVLKRGQDAIDGLLLSASVLQEADEVGLAARIGGPPQEFEVQAVNDPLERFRRAGNAVRPRALAQAWQRSSPAVPLLKCTGPTQEVFIERGDKLLRVGELRSTGINDPCAHDAADRGVVAGILNDGSGVGHAPEIV